MISMLHKAAGYLKVNAIIEPSLDTTLRISVVMETGIACRAPDYVDTGVQSEASGESYLGSGVLVRSLSKLSIRS